MKQSRTMHTPQLFPITAIMGFPSRELTSAVLIPLIAILQGCSTYRTLDPAQVGNDSAGNPRVVDQTEGHYGQPYFLPKGLIHLVVKPEGGGGDSSATAAANNNTNVITVNTAASPEKKAAEKATDLGTEPVAYKITVERVLVADPLAGPYFARYEQNWLYAEGVSVGVTDEGLLSTVNTTASDRTAQVISNLEDTAINVAKFAAQGGLASARIVAEATPPPIPRVRYKRLNIDVTFDPLDPAQRANVESLFERIEIPNAEEGNTILVSPFLFSMHTAAKLGHELQPKAAKQHGLWFRETMPVRLDFRQNSEEFRAAVSDNLKTVREAVKPYVETQKAAKKKHAVSNAELIRSTNAVNEAKKSLQEATSPEGRRSAQANLDLRMEELKKNADQEEKDNEAYSEAQTVADKATAILASLNQTAAAPALSRTATFVKTIPNPARTFAFNVARSAFIQNKKTDLTISNGLLTKVSLEKQSEAEGFSEIPLKLAQKLATLPKDLLTVRTEKVTAEKGLVEAQKNAVNEKAALETATTNRTTSAETARLQAETERIKAQAELIKAQKALQSASASP